MNIDEPSFLENHSGYNNLKFLAVLSKNTKKGSIENALEKVGLNKQDWKKS